MTSTEDGKTVYTHSMTTRQFKSLAEARDDLSRKLEDAQRLAEGVPDRTAELEQAIRQFLRWQDDNIAALLRDYRDKRGLDITSYAPIVLEFLNYYRLNAHQFIGRLLPENQKER